MDDGVPRALKTLSVLDGEEEKESIVARAPHAPWHLGEKFFGEESASKRLDRRHPILVVIVQQVATILLLVVVYE